MDRDNLLELPLPLPRFGSPQQSTIPVVWDDEGSETDTTSADEPDGKLSFFAVAIYGAPNPHFSQKRQR